MWVGMWVYGAITKGKLGKLGSWKRANHKHKHKCKSQVGSASQNVT